MTDGVPDSTAAERLSAGRDAGESGERPTGFGGTTAFLVRQSVTPGATEDVRALVADVKPPEPDGTAWLLDGDGVVTVSLFLDRAGDDGGDGGGHGDGAGAASTRDALVWYVEVDDERKSRLAGELARGVADVVERQSPLSDRGLVDLLGPGPTGDVDARQLVVHATNPNRPGTAPDADVVLPRIGIRSGVPTLFARGLAGMIERLRDTRVEQWFEAESMAVIEDERMWTETLWLERDAGGYAVRWYQEADDMEYVMEAYDASDSPVARVGDVVLNYLFETSFDELDDPVAATDAELLAHATDPDRF